ncbi:hypothetical protein COX21_03490 [Candidatus Falkowbacteria bacterium CG23_combo_of_CG06-09_8_20_14_all_41_10]|uniref:Uncharacterized protein n=1 Tax=Candidatus Falkowbacteria bacterium CG23_combo_of_CG06-09_8_20_14_all_41_10 TaxID=1974571 RepID=A0A2G9ZMB2_9BACT|nr:MAG: hypothetical protein COX21_03490 [Candidatus Falkowbacteria bacterium CG23_combo_of_CG06-09_8_20_14_all_41_10]
MSAIDFDRIYVPPFHNERDKIKELVRIALENGFKCLPDISIEEQVQKLTEKKNYLVLEKFKTELTISNKEASSIMPRLGNDDVKIYSLEKAREWIMAKAEEIK